MIVFKSLINGSLLDPIGGNNGTLTAGVSRGFVQTDKGLALEFDGADTLVTCGDSTEIQNVFDGGGSAEAWINLKSSGESNAGRIVTKGGWTFYQGSASGIGSKLRLYQFFSGVDGWWETDDVTIIFNIWHHVIVTYDNSAVTNNPILYVNGVKYSVGDGLTEQATPVGTRTTDVGTDLTIGGGVGSDGTTDGNILNAQLYDHVLTTKERNELYANFLASSQIGQPKRGFTVQKPTDLSRYVDDTVGDNVVTNGGFDTDTGWTKEAGWTISGGLANAVASTGRIYQSAIVTGTKYLTTYTISNYVSGSIRIEVGGNQTDEAGVTRSANGTYTEVLTCISSNNLFFDGMSAFTGSVDNVFVHPLTGLVAAYNMTLDEDGTVSDLSGNGNDGTNYGGIPDDKGIYFNGASYIDLGSAFQSTMRGDFSFVIRFKPDDGQPATDNTLIGCLNASTEDWFYIQSKSTGALRNYYEANNDPLSNYTDVFLADGQEQWYTVVFSVQKNTSNGWNFYANGILVTTLNTTDVSDENWEAWTSSDNMFLGALNNNGTAGTFFTGWISEVKIYNKALVLADAVDNHNQQIKPTLVETFDEGADGIAKLPREWIAGTGTYKISQVNQSDTLPAFPDGIKLYDKYLECTVAGTIATLSGQAYGTWEWDMLKGADGNATAILFIKDDIGNGGSGNGYDFLFDNTEAIRFREISSGTPTNLFTTSASYININQVYHCKVTRTKSGIFNIWLDGVLIVAGGSGSNPVTDTTHTTSVFTVLDNDAGDRVANFTYKDEIQQ